MKDTIIKWFEDANLKVKGAYIVHADLSEAEINKAMKSFESDEGEGIRLLLSVNMLNEGIHIPRVGAVIMLRTTASKIIYLQQLGRCLTAANTERPIVMDMVDNITTTSDVKGIADEFAAWEEARFNQDNNYVPRAFTITDYSMPIKKVITKLAPHGYYWLSVEERIKQIIEFTKQNNRLPKREEELFPSWAKLLRDETTRNLPEIIELKDKYSSTLSEEAINQKIDELLSFMKEHEGIPKKYRPEQRKICSFYARCVKGKFYHPRVEEVIQLKNKFMEESKEILYRRQLKRILEFVEQHGTTPRSKHGKTTSECAEAACYVVWRHLKKEYKDRPEIQELLKKEPVNYRLAIREKRLGEIESFAKEHDRLPIPGKDPLGMFWYDLRTKYSSNPRVDALLQQYPTEYRVVKNRKPRKIKK